MTDRKKKILLSLLGLIFMLGMMGTSLFSFFAARDLQRTELLDNALPLVGDTIYSDIQRDLLRPVFISSLMAGNTFVHDWIIEGEKDLSQMTRYLSQIRSEHNTLTAFFISEQSKNYYNHKGILKKISPNELRDDWYFRVRDMDAPYEINTDLDLASADTLTVFVNYRVVDADGKYLGAIGVGLAIDSISQLLQSYSEEFNRSVYFINPQGQIMLGGKPHGHAISLDEIEGLSDLGTRITSTEKELALSFQEGSAEIFLNSRYINELGWFLMVEQHEDVLSHSTTKTLITNLLASLAIALVFLWLAHRVLFAYRHDIETRAAFDNLTGAYNRHEFEDLVEQFMKFTDRKTDKLSLLMVDIDHFKPINDEYGHLAGDDAIQYVVKAIERSLRNDDAVCRWGGDEFCVMLKKCDALKAGRVAEKIRSTVERATFCVNSVHVPITVSIGVAEPEPGETLHAVIARADDALYNAKNSGRNRYRFAQVPAVDSTHAA